MSAVLWFHSRCHRLGASYIGFYILPRLKKFLKVSITQKFEFNCTDNDLSQEEKGWGKTMEQAFPKSVSTAEKLEKLFDVVNSEDYCFEVLRRFTNTVGFY